MSSAPLAEFGRYIRELRESRQWSREYLEEFGISKSTVERWESGEISRPRRSTFEQFAKAFDLNVDALIQRYKNSIVSDTTQAVDYPSSNDTTFTSIQSDPTELTASSSIERQPMSWRGIFEAIHRRRSVYYVVPVCVVALTIFTLISSSWVQNNTVKPVIIAGKVLCANNEPIVNVWVDVFKGSNVDKDISGYANLSNLNSNGSEVSFAYVLKGDGYNLHVGCGGSKQRWKSTYTTETYGPVHDHKLHFFICHDVISGIDYGPCDLKY